MNSQNNEPSEKKTSRGTVIAAVIIIAAFVILICVLASTLLRDFSGSKNTEKDSEAEIKDTEKIGSSVDISGEKDTESETERSVISSAVKYTTAEMPTDLIYEGDLILVNSEHVFNFKGTDKFITLYGNKSNNYLLSSSFIKASPKAINALGLMLDRFYELTERSNVLVKAAYRSFEEQQQIYDNCFATYGEKAATYVAVPGCSDHNTGLSFDLGVYSDDGVVYTLEYDEEYLWIMNNCVRYGFILRFSEKKASITGISTDLFHFRYVGIPHAVCISDHDFCLEEYIEFLKQYTFSSDHLFVETDEGRYEIYYAPADVSAETQTVPVPENCDYRVSGNNCDGFVIWFKI